MKINLNTLSQILLDGMLDRALDKSLSEKILGNVSDEDYDLACNIYHETLQAYFELGLKLWADITS